MKNGITQILMDGKQYITKNGKILEYCFFANGNL